MKKQETRIQKINIFAEVPLLHESPNLETDCREITTEQPKMLLEEGDLAREETSRAVPEEEAEFFDPEDPLYGLEQRLQGLHLDDESRKVIKDKLLEATNKIKHGLEQRQSSLDAKLAAATIGKKK